MQIPNSFNQLSNKADIIQVIKNACAQNAQKLNCMRIGIIKEFYPDSLTVKVLIANKKVIGQNSDGTQKVRDYAPIIAKVCYANPFCTFPITEGMECILLFSDREIESWFINGSVNPRGYERMHDLTDAVAIVGIRSLPQMITILTDCLNLFYGNSSFNLQTDAANLNSATITLQGDTININGNLVINGQAYTDHTHSNGNNGSPTGGVIS